MSQIKKAYHEIYHFYRMEVRKPFFIILFIFCILTVLLYFFFMNNAELTFQTFDRFTAGYHYQDIINEQGDLNAMGIFRNNLIASFYSVAAGMIPFVFFCFLPLLLNACSIAVICATARLYEGTFVYIIAGLLPHGIFEIPAIILAITLGFLLCKSITRNLIDHQHYKKVSEITRPYLCFFIMIILPLLLVAAWIEAYITPTIMLWFS